jgi:general stress protein 26
VKILLETAVEIRQQIWQELGRATQDRHHDWRTPVLATTGDAGWPDARTVVLRQARAEQQQLRFFTDRRSPKVVQLRQQPQAMLVFWSPRLGWQLRVRLRLSVMDEGPEVQAIWQGLQHSAAAGDYLSPQPPGTPLSTEDPPTPSTTPHLALLQGQVIEMDWLELSREGHRRARVIAQDWTWLTP